jgi:redox-sensitive bicupin YhaK (pirin superfamily)
MKYDVIQYEDLGKFEHGWLHSNFHFSFANYYNPEKMGFGFIRVINDDIIEPNNGFEPHPHNNMEIITFVRKGAITHKDNLGNEGRTEAGDVQVMSAGKGIIHSEFNLEEEQTNIYQIWILPNKKNVEPRWDTGTFKNKEKNKLNLLVDSFESNEDCLKIHQDVKILSCQYDTESQKVKYTTNKKIYILCSEGKIRIENINCILHKGDALQIEEVSEVSIISGSENSEFILIET